MAALQSPSAIHSSYSFTRPEPFDDWRGVSVTRPRLTAWSASLTVLWRGSGSMLPFHFVCQ